MIVDTSAIVSIWLKETGWEQISTVLQNDPAPCISAATLVELYAVIDSRSSPENQRRLDALLAAYGIMTEPFTANQARIAREAYRDFGKRSGHPARLNLGDCFAYALASSRHEPILFVGDDFSRTDLVPALPREDHHANQTTSEPGSYHPRD